MDGTTRIELLRIGRLRGPISAIVVASIIFVFAIGVLLIVRRWSGALTAPLPVPQLVVTAAGLCVWATIVRELTVRRRPFVWLSLSAFLLFAVGCSYPGNRLVDWLVWLAAIATVVSPRMHWRPKSKFLLQRLRPQQDGGPAVERVLQQLWRTRTADGKDLLRGTLLAEFTPGERQVTLYVGFCPPFEMLPIVEAEVADGFEAELKLAPVLHNGAQIEVRLSEAADEPIGVTIDFLAAEVCMVGLADSTHPTDKRYNPRNPL